ncbi:hypothetical protein L6R50_00400 [Myxococcota bacterium]|nr:hypothetical protein [Myxococcota bacterium]
MRHPSPPGRPTRRLGRVALAAGLAFAGCGEAEPYYSGDPPEIVSMTPAFEDGITGCNVVRIEVDDPSQCQRPSVVFGNRNATVVTDANLDALRDFCDTSVELRDDVITVISPPGPIQTGKVDVRVGCEHGVASLDDGYDYRVSSRIPGSENTAVEYASLFDDEIGSFSLQYYDSTLFGGVPFVGGYGFLNSQPSPRGATFWGGNPDSVASTTGIRAQIPPRAFAPPDVNRVQAGDLIRFYRNRHNVQDPIGTDAGVLQLQVAAPGADCDPVDVDTDGDNTPDATQVDGYCFFALEGIEGGGGDVGKVTLYFKEPVMGLPGGSYFAQVCEDQRELGFNNQPSGPLEEGNCLDYETFTALELSSGAESVTLPGQNGIDMRWDGDIRYYTNDFLGPNNAPFDKPMCMSWGASYSYGVNFEAGDYGAECAQGLEKIEDINAAGAITIPPMDIGSVNNLTLLPDGGNLASTIGAVHIGVGTLDELKDVEVDWDAFDPETPSTCPGLLVRWDTEEGERKMSKNDYYTVDFRVWDDMMPFNFFGTFEVFRLTAFAWHRSGGLCIPARELAKAPPSMFPFGSTVADDEYVSTRYSAYLYINHHRVQKIPMTALGNMVVDVKTLDVTIFSNTDNCHDAVDNDGDGLVDGADPGCGLGDGMFEGITQCNNGVDDDADGWRDEKDPGCYRVDDATGELVYDALLESEGGTNAAYDCNDGVDNDADGEVDEDDRGCDDGLDDDEDSNNCSDHVDGDGDGWTDGDDPDCVDAESREVGLGTTGCNDGADEDGDGWTDAADPDCTEAGDDEVGPGTAECNDGLDNDLDGSIDALDPECVEADGGEGDAPPGGCEDGLDNDGDGWTDDADPDCVDAAADEVGPGTTGCNDGTDEDGDGWIDAADPDCVDAAADEVGPGTAQCNDGADNDGDALIDAEDPECVAAGTGAWDDEANAPPP